MLSDLGAPVTAPATWLGVATGALSLLGWYLHHLTVLRRDREMAANRAGALDPDELARSSSDHAPSVGVKVVHYATRRNYTREVWVLGPAPRGWHLVSTSTQPLTGRNVPSEVLVCRDLAQTVDGLDRAGWPMVRPAPEVPS